MSEDTKPPVDPGANPNDPNSIKPGWPFLSLPWFRKRVSWTPNAPLSPSTNPMTDALVSGKAPVDAPSGFEVAFNEVIRLLMAVIIIGRAVGMSVLAAMGAESKWRGKLRRALQRGATVPQIVNAFIAANVARLFEDAHYDGSDVWFMLTYPRTIEAAQRADERGLITYDLEEVLDRLDLGIGYAGNHLAPGAVEAARVAQVPRGWKNPDVFFLVEALGLRAGGGYDDIFREMTDPQQVLDREAIARGDFRGPGGADR